MRISNPLANSYTKNQADNQFLTVDLSGSSSGAVNPIDADTLDGKPASDYVLKSTLYPVGSIYMSINSTNPSTYFGGTWERIQGKFLLSADDSSYIAGTTGGEATHTLTTEELPSHTHRITERTGNVDTGSSWRALATNSGSAPITGSVTSYPTGGGKAHNNMPPYLTVYMWERTA